MNTDLRVSVNVGIPKWLVDHGESEKQMDDLGVPPFLETSICIHMCINKVDRLFISWFIGLKKLSKVVQYVSYVYIVIYIHVRFSIMKKNTEDEKPTNVGVNH